MGIFFAKQQLSKIAVSSHNNNNNNNIHYTAISNISTRLSMVCRSVDTATPPPSGGGLCSTLQCYRAPKICTVLTRTVCTRPKKNYLKVLVQIFFDCSLVDLFI